jgi:coenzyme F420-0:L-glutamate ligase/coenzyme F420-1:gamma-L-glutamate ligase
MVARFVALEGIPAVKPGDDLVEIILNALAISAETLQNGDVLVITQKIVSKAQNRFVRLDAVEPSAEAERVARIVNKDSRLVELILRESTDIVRHRRDVLIVAHKLGLVMANAGIDQSNIQHDSSDDTTALLLPEDPDATCAQIRAALRERTGADAAVIISDSHGRPFRSGTVGVAIGASGLSTLVDLRGASDLFGRQLKSTDVASADEIASAASLLMGQANEGRPLVLARGLLHTPGEGTAAGLVRSKSTDLFRASPAADALDLIAGRRSIRRYTPEPVSDEIIEKILNAAANAPSAHNRQPWRFAVIKEASIKQRLARSMGDRLRHDRAQDGDSPETIEADVIRSEARIVGAPIAILVALTIDDMDSYPDSRRAAAEYQMAVQSTAMAMQNLTLAAHALGLGASIMCAPLFCPDEVRDALTLPASWNPQALVTLGYPANTGTTRPRRPLDDVVVTVGQSR